MKKRIIRKVIGLGSLVSLTSVVFAEEIKLLKTGTSASQTISAALKGAQTMVVGGGVIAAAWGLYQVAFGEGSGKDWFLVIIGGALVGGYGAIGNAIVGFFK